MPSKEFTMFFFAGLLAVLGVASGRVVRTTDDSECSPICTFIYRPVCGSNGELYSNNCVMEYAACTSGTEIVGTPCLPVTCEGYEPNGACTMEWNPVCDLQGNQYSNQCEITHHACSNDLQLYMRFCE